MMHNGNLARWNLVAVAAAFALGTGACMTGDTREGSTELAAKGTKPDPGKGGGGTGGCSGAGGGQCSDLLVHGCDGATGAKLEQCKTDLLNAFDQCVKVAHCQDLRDQAAKDCGKDIACLEKADQIFSDCIGPGSGTGPDPGK
jgi:hypothetical protein